MSLSARGPQGRFVQAHFDLDFRDVHEIREGKSYLCEVYQTRQISQSPELIEFVLFTASREWAIFRGDELTEFPADRIRLYPWHGQA